MLLQPVQLLQRLRRQLGHASHTTGGHYKSQHCVTVQPQSTIACADPIIHGLH